MHTLHGSTASVSAASTTSGANGGPARKHRYSSRSNSLSSASVITVKRTGSRSSSSTGVRTSAGPVRPQSPGDPSASSFALRLGRDPMTQEHRRRQSVAVDPSERTNGEGMGSLHHWSHSTSSSVTSATLARHRASSGAVLPAMPTQPYSPHKKTRSIVDHSPRPSPHRRKPSSRQSSRRRASPSPERERRLPLTALPPLHTTPALTDPNDTESPSTIPVATPSTQSSYGQYGQDYFGDDGASPRNNGKTKKPVVIRNHTATMSNADAARSQAVEGAYDMTDPGSRGIDTEDGPPTATLRSKYSDVTNAQEMTVPSTTGESSRHRRSGTRERTEKEKKAMLSKALQKANTAVLLDNAQNFEGALEAYSDACRLLQQVMDRTSGAEDKKKLDSIRVTYTNRVEELRQLEAAQSEVSHEKSLPTRPMSDESLPISPDSGSTRSPTIDAHFAPSPSPVFGTASVAQAVDAPMLPHREEFRNSFFSRTTRAMDTAAQQDVEKQPEPTVQEPAVDILGTQPRTEERNPVLPRSIPSPMLQEAPSFSERKAVSVPPLNVDGLHIPPSNSRYMPAPLSPRRPSIPDINPHIEEREDEVPPLPPLPEPVENPATNDTTASGSWLDPIDESDSSCASSVHSVSSQQGLHRKHIRAASGDSNPDFDAAFDAAVEAAYNEGLEPDLEVAPIVEPASTRHAAKESLSVPSSDIKEILSPTNSYHPNNTTMDLGLDDDEEEEERILDDITQDYAQAFNFDLASKSALPRQSDSSGYSRSTWQSSQASDRTTAGTSLSTVAEDGTHGAGSKNSFAASTSLNSVLADPPPPPSAPPPSGSLPKIPSMAQDRVPGVRSRRLSGQNMKQLKIETQPESRPRASTFHHSASPFKEEDEQSLQESNKDLSFGSDLQPTASMSSEQRHEHMLISPPSLDMLSVVADSSRPNTATTITTDQRRSIDDMPGDLHSSRPTLIRKNMSSLSLREHTVILASPMEAPAALTPMSSTYMTFASKRQNDAPITAQRAQLPAFGTSYSDHMPGGVYLFDTSLSNPQLPTSPRSPAVQQPVGLEPCPDSFLLRPFWLMRAIGSTLTHSKGGFLTTRLFVTREVWQTKGVKLKSIDDKIANCDLLTAALGRLALVDTYDADALMEELQSFEEVMERVQTSLVKKLGSDVGVGGLAGLFKDAAAGVASSGAAPSAEPTISGAERTKSKENKGYLNSWRKLRSKSSGAPITGGQMNHRVLNKTAEKELPTMPSVPMTSFVPVERRGVPKKDPRSLVFDGPNRDYMGSLARLFESAQVLGKCHPHAILTRFLPNTVNRFADVFGVHCRSNRPPSRRPGAQRLVAHARRPRAEYSACGRVLRLLCVSVCTGGFGGAGG